jgi:glycosyltransferase involved in cell wall biosynthesis
MIPRFSIITVTYNAEDSIEGTVQSVVSQEFKNFEYIIIDGASTDKTLAILNKYDNDIDKVISEKDQGLYHAMNKGIRAAKGEFLLFLNAGDRFVHASILNEVDSRILPKTRIVSADFINVKEEGAVDGSYIQTKACTLNNLKKDFAACHQTVFIHRSVASEYDLRYTILADYKWVVQASSQCKLEAIAHIKTAIVYYLDGGLSARYVKQNVLERVRLHYELFGRMQVIKNIPNYLRRILRELKRLS